jgi:sugar lactone lactonase YvrE
VSTTSTIHTAASQIDRSSRHRRRRGLGRTALGLAVACILGSVTAWPALAGDYTYVTEWGGIGSAGATPYGVAVDASGHVYDTDSENYFVEKFSSTGTFLTRWNGVGDGQLQYPAGIAVDGSGNNVYVADRLNRRVQKFSSTGTFLTGWFGTNQFALPDDVAVDASGNVYVTFDDSFGFRVEKFTSTGTFLTQWDRPALGIAIDGAGNIYFTNPGNDRIEKFNSAGTFLTGWGSPGSGDGQFNIPFAVAVDASGNVYVADTHNNRIQKFSSTGTFLTKWGGVSGSLPGQFRGPTGIAVDGSGNVYVADSTNVRIQKFAPSAYAALVLRDGPVGSWRFDESRGTIAHDAAGTNNGTYLHGFRLGQPGMLADDTAVGLDGQSGYISVPDSPSLHTGDSFSLEAWVKRSYLSTYNGTEGLFAKGYQVYLDGGNFGSGGWLVLRKPNGDVIARSTVTITDRNFHHVVVTKSGPDVHLYIDGVDVTGKVSNRTITDTSGTLSIGAGAASTFRGVIDEAAVYNFALSPAEVASHYAAGH